eukprot:768141-Hanusia_phi.AAC.3
MLVESHSFLHPTTSGALVRWVHSCIASSGHLLLLVSFGVEHADFTWSAGKLRGCSSSKIGTGPTHQIQRTQPQSTSCSILLWRSIRLGSGCKQSKVVKAPTSTSSSSSIKRNIQNNEHTTLVLSSSHDTTKSIGKNVFSLFSFLPRPLHLVSPTQHSREVELNPVYHVEIDNIKHIQDLQTTFIPRSTPMGMRAIFTQSFVKFLLISRSHHNPTQPVRTMQKQKQHSLFTEFTLSLLLTEHIHTPAFNVYRTQPHCQQRPSNETAMLVTGPRWAKNLLTNSISFGFFFQNLMCPSALQTFEHVRPCKHQRHHVMQWVRAKHARSDSHVLKATWQPNLPVIKKLVLVNLTCST